MDVGTAASAVQLVGETDMRKVTTSLYQRHDHPSCPTAIDGERPKHRCRGRWVAAIDYGTAKDGSRRRRVLYGTTKAEAQGKLTDALADEVHALSDPSGKVLTVGAWMDEWLRDYKPKLRDSTRQSHGSKIRTYIKPLIGQTRLDRLTTLQVEQIESRLTRPCPSPNTEGKCVHKPSHGLSDATARQTFVILKDALGDAVKAGHIRRSPAENADAPGTHQAQRPHLQTPVADRVLKLAEKQGTAARWYCALEMGLRQSEALGLTWGLVDLDAGWMSIEQTRNDAGQIGRPKSDAGWRAIPLTTGTWQSLRALHTKLTLEGNPPQPSDFVFPVGHKTDWKAWRDLLAAAGVPHVALHSARQSAARRLDENGTSPRAAATFLGQSNVNMVYRYQRGADVETLRKAIGA